MKKLFSTLFLSLLCATATAQEVDINGKIAVELNTAETQDGRCTLTFMITNGTKSTVDKVVYETVLFDHNGRVDRLTLFDFGKLPAGRPRVRQFAVPSLACENLGRILFNGASTCEGADLVAGICDTGLMPTSRTGIEVIG